MHCFSAPELQRLIAGDDVGLDMADLKVPVCSPPPLSNRPLATNARLPGCGLHMAEIMVRLMGALLSCSLLLRRLLSLPPSPPPSPPPSRSSAPSPSPLSSPLHARTPKANVNLIGGYTAGHKSIKWLWEIVGAFSHEDQGLSSAPAHTPTHARARTPTRKRTYMYAHTNTRATHT